MWCIDPDIASVVPKPTVVFLLLEVMTFGLFVFFNRLFLFYRFMNGALQTDSTDSKYDCPVYHAC